MQPTPPAPQRFDLIDALRGVAALWVFFYHLWNPLFPYQHTQNNPAHWTGNESWVFYVTFFLFQYGYFGVTIFFVVSGFCIHLPQARRHAQTGSDGLKLEAFFKRRFWRLYPAYFAGLFVAALGLGAMRLMEYRARGWPLPLPEGFYTEAFGLDLIAINALFLSPFFEAAKNLNSVLWTLVFEVQFYLLYPLLLLLMRGLQKYGSLLGLLLVGCILLGCEVFLAEQPKRTPEEILAHHAGLLTLPDQHALWLSRVATELATTRHNPWFYFFLNRYFEWYLGVLAAELLVNKGQILSRSKSWLGLLLTIALSLFSTFNLSTWPYRDIFVATATFFLIAVLLQPRPPSAKANPLISFLSWAGLFSYSLYLLHIPLLRLVATGNTLLAEWFGWNLTNHQMNLLLLDSIPIVLLFSYGFYYLFERPFLKPAK